MGTDIHVAMQAKKDGVWQDIEHKYNEDRHYFLFSWLANVRNGYGFAGVATYTPVAPISQPRGLPDDFQMDADCHPVSSKEQMGRRAEWLEDGEEPSIWMGDHSHSWLTADEILSAPVPGRTWRTGIVNRDFFDAWDGHTPPTEWSGGISGPEVVVAESPCAVDEDTTHVRINWMHDEGKALTYFIDEIKRLKELHGEVRMIFGFDS